MSQNEIDEKLNDMFFNVKGENLKKELDKAIARVKSEDLVLFISEKFVKGEGTFNSVKWKSLPSLFFRKDCEAFIIDMKFMCTTQVITQIDQSLLPSSLTPRA